MENQSVEAGDVIEGLLERIKSLAKEEAVMKAVNTKMLKKTEEQAETIKSLQNELMNHLQQAE